MHLEAGALQYEIVKAVIIAGFLCKVSFEMIETPVLVIFRIRDWNEEMNQTDSLVVVLYLS